MVTGDSRIFSLQKIFDCDQTQRDLKAGRRHQYSVRCDFEAGCMACNTASKAICYYACYTMRDTDSYYVDNN
jgi:hypothetical protein